MERQTGISDLAEKLTTTVDSVKIRIVVITDIEVTTDRRVQTDDTGAAWIPRAQDIDLDVGDRVLMLQEGPVAVVVGRLSGGLR